jgi:predicted nucleic acid-binding protein
LHARLRRHSRIALDTSIFIYAVEANPKYLALADEVFGWLERPGHTAVTSSITLTELLVAPYRDEDEQRVDAFYGLLTTYPNLEWIPPDLEIADAAAGFRARYRLRTPDALQAATAVRSHATAMVTNDPAFARVAEFESLVLDKL